MLNIPIIENRQEEGSKIDVDKIKWNEKGMQALMMERAGEEGTDV